MAEHGYLLFEEDGEFKAGTVRAAAEASFQVDTASGKRVKVKAGNVLLRFAQPRAEDLLAAAQATAAALDTNFLWECAPQEEFGFEQLAQDYYGHAPSAIEATAILLRLQSAPVYFQRKGRGRFRPASAEVLRQALAALERRRQLEAQRAALAEALCAGELPPAIAVLGADLLLRADRNGIEYKAVEQAAHALQLTPLRLLLARGAIAAPYDWHVAAFRARAFPRGIEFPEALPAVPALAPLPPAPVAAFSIDDSATTEIDDAFSVQALGELLVVGVHIAAPALAIAAGDAVDAVARSRMSTVYAPGIKYTMLPPAWIEAFSLAEGRNAAAVSLYLSFDAHTLAWRGARTAVERVPIAANLRYDLLEDSVSAERLAAGDPQLPHGAELAQLWRVANALRAERERVRGRPEASGREEVQLVLDGEGAAARVRRQVRRRDAPLDRIVAELMIAANRHWGAWLEENGLVGIYRCQAQGRVRMTTAAAPHEGLGVSHYAWCTSPLRRYVDLLNQRQIIAAATGATAPHRRGDADLFAVVSGFEAAYASYSEFQSAMERYWSLRWLQQEGVTQVDAVVGRGDIVHVQGLPLSLRLAAAASYERGQLLRLEVVSMDLLELSLEARIVQAASPVPGAQALAALAEGEDADDAGGSESDPRP